MSGNTAESSYLSDPCLPFGIASRTPRRHTITPEDRIDNLRNNVFFTRPICGAESKPDTQESV